MFQLKQLIYHPTVAIKFIKKMMPKHEYNMFMLQQQKIYQINKCVHNFKSCMHVNDVDE